MHRVHTVLWSLYYFVNVAKQTLSSYKGVIWTVREGKQIFSNIQSFMFGITSVIWLQFWSMDWKIKLKCVGFRQRWFGTLFISLMKMNLWNFEFHNCIALSNIIKLRWKEENVIVMISHWERKLGYFFRKETSCLIWLIQLITTIQNMLGRSLQNDFWDGMQRESVTKCLFPDVLDLFLSMCFSSGFLLSLMV